MQPLRALRFLPALLAVGLVLAVVAPVAAPACAAMMVEVQAPCCCGDDAPAPCPPADSLPRSSGEAPVLLACCSSLADLAAPAPELPAPPAADVPVRELAASAAPTPVVPRTPPPTGPPPPRRPHLALQVLQV